MIKRNNQVEVKAGDRVSSGHNTLVRYRPLGDSAKWLSLFVGPTPLITPGHMGCLGMGVGMPVFIGSVVVGGLGLPLYQKASADTPLLLLLWIPLLYFAVRGAKIIVQPTHIEISEQGVRILRVQMGQKTKWISWSEISSISLSCQRNSTSNDSQIICFNMKKKKIRPLEVRLAGLIEANGAEELLTALQKWGKEIPKDFQVLASLESQRQNTYTELWLQSLSEPPQRERLTPLCAGTQLKEAAYQITEVVGGGGQGTAYLAVVKKSGLDREPGDNVVLKEYVLPLHVTRDARKSSIERLQNEAKLLRTLNHKQVVKLIDFFVEDHRGYLVLERISGRSLRQRVNESGALSVAEVRQLALQMCDILEHLHGCTPPVVHRDFTPDNLMLDDQKILHLIDFNVAMQSSSTTTATVVGKHAYVPPEQFRGKPTAQSDIYAMGATLYFLLCGHDPEPLQEAQPSAEIDGLDADIDLVVSSCTQIDADTRYSSVQEIKQVLAAC